MTKTDNRTNEITEAQVEAAAKAMHERDLARSEELYPNRPSMWAKLRPAYYEHARAALTAAQGAAPVLPSSGVDEDALAEEIGRHKLVHVSVSRKSAFCMCNSSVKAGVDDNVSWFAKHRARAVAEWFMGQER